MSFSRAEIMALATKAARGAGAPPAQAAEFGRASVAHLAHGRAEADLIAALEALPAGAIVDIPALFLEIAAMGGVGKVAGAFPHGLLHSYVESLPFAAICEGDRISIDPGTPATRAAPVRLRPGAAFLAQLEHWAAETYVPESESSRIGGAGAGLSDND